ncbi:N-acetylglucosamine kinase [Micromonospora sp. NPDC047740]|uniref:N-acetylglucosamine kinase n=1 Tax=Micromonospora sp. NPDC047740 TaxID=3364254 RepID=UPI00371FCC67
MTAYVLGIDGGQSSTRCVLGTLDGRLLASGTGPPLSHVAEPGGRDRVCEAVAVAAGRALDAVRPRPHRVAAAYLSLTAGITEAGPALRALVDVDRLHADTDAMGALASGTLGRPGIVVAAGTGVVALALGPDGQQVTAGGWGHRLGDEGGGYWLGLHGIRAAIRGADGRGPATSLTARIVADLGLPHLRELFNAAADGTLDVPRIAGLARIVAAEAAAGDPAARELIAAAATELASLAEVVASRAGFLPTPRTVVGTGGVLTPTGPVWTAFVAELGRRLPDAIAVRPSVPPVVGAYLLALDMAGHPATAGVLATVRSTMTTRENL